MPGSCREYLSTSAAYDSNYIQVPLKLHELNSSAELTSEHPTALERSGPAWVSPPCPHLELYVPSTSFALALAFAECFSELIQLTN